jgi:hypothetical protein
MSGEVAGQAVVASGSGGFTTGRKMIARERSREKRIREWEQQWQQKTGEPRRRRGCLRGEARRERKVEGG